MINQLHIAAGWSPARLESLRAELQRRALDGFLIPRWDAYQSEYCAPHDERLAWISGFTGSWGLALITLSRAVVFIDGRYTVQARAQVSAQHFEFRHLYDEPVDDWLLENAASGQTFGYDAAILTPALFDSIAEAATQVDVKLEATPTNPVDAVWADQPELAPNPVLPFPLERAGEPSMDKRLRIAQNLKAARVRWLVESQPDNVAWLLNLRGSDAMYTPLPHARAIVSDGGEVELCMDERKLTEERNRYELEGVTLHAPQRFFEVLKGVVRSGDRVLIDPKFSPVGAVEVTRAVGGRPVVQADPLTRLKAVKNVTELQGLRAASQRDSIAWIHFLIWIEENVSSRDTAGRPITEWEAEERILAFRRELKDFMYPSFRTISAADASAAMCHYAAPAGGGRPVRRDSIYLIDSGGQYLDGTTDTTRTLCFSPPPAEIVRNYTLVLKGHARLASARFPPGTRGHQIDALAREALWRHGLDYDHGTGHGVGHFLSVHEHPQRLMKDASPAVIEAGMTLTNEPGYYRAGEYGMRIENLCEVVQGEHGFLHLQELTLVPIEGRLIDVRLLEPLEREWLNAYHTRVRVEMTPLLANNSARRWLATATEPV